MSDTATTLLCKHGVLRINVCVECLREKYGEPSLKQQKPIHSGRLDGGLIHLLRVWRDRCSEYDRESSKQSKIGGDARFAASRYEGISTGTRWCLEDLKKLLEEGK